MTQERMQQIYERVAEYLIKSGFQALMGILILIIGFKLAGWAARFFTKLCQKKNLDITLTHFLAGVVKTIITVFAALIALDKFGITISPFIAAISAMIFGASFAIQAPLSNYAAGLSIIFTRPFVVGNTISVKGYEGVVEDIRLPNTVLSTGDGETVTIPNKDIVGEVIINSQANKVTETCVGISYGDDPQKAISLILRCMDAQPEILKTPAPLVGIRDFGESSVNLRVRYWAPTKRSMVVLHELNMAIYRALTESGIRMPYPQREVRVLSDKANGASLPWTSRA